MFMKQIDSNDSINYLLLGESSTDPSQGSSRHSISSFHFGESIQQNAEPRALGELFRSEDADALCGVRYRKHRVVTIPLVSSG